MIPPSIYLYNGKAIYTPGGAAGEYAKFAANFYNGCSNDCDYCYLKRGTRSHVWSTKPTIKREFVNRRPKKYAAMSPEDYAIHCFCHDLDRLAVIAPQDLMRYGIFLSFSTDPMLSETVGLTFRAASIALRRRIPVMILTKCAEWQEEKPFGQQTQTFKYWEYAMQGALTIPCDNCGMVPDLSKLAFGFTLTGRDDKEPHASPNAARILRMGQLHHVGFKTFASLEPVIDFKATREIVRQTIGFCDYYMIGLESGVKDSIYTWQQIREGMGDIMNLLNAYHVPYLVKESVHKRMCKDNATIRDLFSYMPVNSDYSIFNQGL